MKRTDVIKKLREMRIDEKKIGKLSWKFLPDHLKMDALLSAIKDPDEAEQYVEFEWDDLPPAVTQNMTLESVNEGLKSVQKRDWDKADDDQKEEWLLQAFSDPDDAGQYIEFEWDDLPPDATQNMTLESVNEGKDTISMDRLKEIIKEEVINETRNLDKMQSKLRTVDNAQDVLRTLRDIISDTNTFNGQQFTKLEDIYEEIRDLKNDSGMNIGDLVSPAILAAFKKDMAEIPTVLSMLSDLEGDRVSKYAEFGE